MKLDIKIVLIVVLSLGLIVSVWLRPEDSTIIVDKLKMENRTLLLDVDSLKKVNTELDKRNLLTKEKLIQVECDLVRNNKKINDLKNDKKQIYTFVDSLGLSGVQRELTKYLNNKTK
tara:strand:+ start:11314 stop:11664 length:351 start_codon:yes stop_codon:yes gene_type:complete